ncbi:hypothetical protein [Legionella hackeliae]|uniref:Uncharacterized protein n=1 Tax=Legionella hackeliae TaxID=449 RepID=A0A0A8USA5_LEGHA|nr:hypothetical protein [Legionella hackeliae]KTD09949.1 putative FlgJ-like protein [Legionella hackeliae]CEK11750.1 conserved protein of unknown function [Legionella hackeliae]STX48520.1 putative FlgJ-like protein [Legionella hackeliae]
MEKDYIRVTPHPKFLELLFAFRSELFSIFRDVLGLHEINHIAISRVSEQGELITFSSTPALEFNLFSNRLWYFDKSYHPTWFRQCTQNEWPTLYVPRRYDELYYSKQIKHQYPLGLSLSTQLNDVFFIYSLASHSSSLVARELFTTHVDDFYKIGEYCSEKLSTFFARETK